MPVDLVESSKFIFFSNFRKQQHSLVSSTFLSSHHYFQTTWQQFLPYLPFSIETYNKFWMDEITQNPTSFDPTVNDKLRCDAWKRLIDAIKKKKKL
jgi:hypothetical protein